VVLDDDDFILDVVLGATIAGVVVVVSVVGSLLVLELLLLDFLLRRLRPGVIASRSQDIIQPLKKKRCDVL
jgi:CHASE2 domain-containing sensor protein